jgi:hypothetical protein
LIPRLLGRLAALPGPLEAVLGSQGVRRLPETAGS